MVDLPLGATEDRVVGALDIERALTRGEKAFDQGRLSCNRLISILAARTDPPSTAKESEP